MFFFFGNKSKSLQIRLQLVAESNHLYRLSQDESLRPSECYKKIEMLFNQIIPVDYEWPKEKVAKFLILYFGLPKNLTLQEMLRIKLSAATPKDQETFKTTFLAQLRKPFDQMLLCYLADKYSEGNCLPELRLTDNQNSHIHTLINSIAQAEVDRWNEKSLLQLKQFRDTEAAYVRELEQHQLRQKEIDAQAEILATDQASYEIEEYQQKLRQLEFNQIQILEQRKKQLKNSKQMLSEQVARLKTEKLLLQESLSSENDSPFDRLLAAIENQQKAIKADQNEMIRQLGQMMILKVQELGDEIDCLRQMQIQGNLELKKFNEAMQKNKAQQKEIIKQQAKQINDYKKSSQEIIVTCKKTEMLLNTIGDKFDKSIVSLESFVELQNLEKNVLLKQHQLSQQFQVITGRVLSSLEKINQRLSTLPDVVAASVVASLGSSVKKEITRQLSQPRLLVQTNSDDSLQSRSARPTQSLPPASSVGCAEFSVSSSAAEQDLRKSILLESGLSEHVIAKLLVSKKTHQDNMSELEMIECMRACIEVGKRSIEKIAGKDIVVLLGFTGAGKSTTINYLRGCNLYKVIKEGRGVIDVRASENETVAAIGHVRTQSMTFMPNFFIENDLVYCDFPGLCDTRGLAIKIANAVNLKNTLAKVKSVRIILLIEYSTLDHGKALGVSELEKFINNLFNLNVSPSSAAQELRKSILVGITKKPDTDENEEELIELAYQSESNTPWLKENIIFIDPLNLSVQEKVVQRIKSLLPIENSGIFKTALSSDDLGRCYELNKKIAANILSFLTRKCFKEAAEITTTLGYLDYCKVEQLDQLYEETVSKVKQHVKDKLVSVIQERIRGNQYASAEALLIEFEQLEKEFSSIINFSSLLQSTRQDLHAKKRKFIINDFNDLFKKLMSSFREQFKKQGVIFARQVYKVLSRSPLEPNSMMNQLTYLQQIELVRSIAASLAGNLKLLSVGGDCGEVTISALNELRIIRQEAEDIDIANTQKILQTIELQIQTALKTLHQRANAIQLLSQVEVLLKILENNNDVDIVLNKLSNMDEFQESSQSLIDSLFAMNAVSRDLVENTKNQIKFSATYQKLLASICETFQNMKETLQKIKKIKVEIQYLRDQIHTNLKQRNFTKLAQDLSKLNLLAPEELSESDIKDAFDELKSKAWGDFCNKDYLNAKHSIFLLKNLEIIMKNFYQALVKPLPGFASLTNFISGFTKEIKKIELSAVEEVNNLDTDEPNDQSRNIKFQNLTSFFDISSIFNTLSDFHSDIELNAGEMRKRCKDKIREKFHKYSQLKIASKIAYFLSVARALVFATKDREITHLFEQLMTDVIHTYRNPDELLPNIGKSLTFLTEHTQVGRYAAEIVDLYPDFFRIKIKLFNQKKARITEADIFEKIDKQCDDLSHSFTPDYIRNIRCLLPALKNSYIHYEKTYDLTLTEIIREFKPNHSEKIKQQRVNEMVTNAVAQVHLLKSDRDNAREPLSSEEKSVVIGKLLAYIFCVWSCLDVYRGGFLDDRQTLMQPHPTQVISVLLMLGNGQLTNHLLEIKTGEGKSFVIAATAVALALQGFEVDIGCYSDYLAQRDQEFFSAFINAFQSFFSKNEQIRYKNFQELMIIHMGQLCVDARDISLNLLKKDSSNVAPTNHFNKPAKRILLIDEVDVFFSENFLGVTYNPLLIIYDPFFISLMREIWANQNLYLDLNDDVEAQKKIKTHPLMTLFLKEYPNISVQLVDYTVKELWFSLKTMAKNKELDAQDQYHVSSKGIGYYDALSGNLVDQLYRRYLTAFAYIKEEANNSSWEKGFVDKKIGFQLFVGFISYMTLPKEYQFILGVTGTLFSFTPLENDILNQYNIMFKTPIPSPFNKKVIRSDLKIEVCETLNEDNPASYFYKIRLAIQESIIAHRAVLVVFENEKRLSEYQKYIEANHSYKFNEKEKSAEFIFKGVNVLTSKTPCAVKNNFILTATAQGQVTLLTKIFGRGADFVCRDAKVIKNGGVHVIQTFFSTDPSEEKQIKGRTGRQDDPGSYQIILYRVGLPFWVEKSELESLSDENLYKLLQEKRKIFLEEKDTRLSQAVEKTKKEHTDTLNFLTKSKKNKEERQQALELVLSFQPGNESFKNVL